MPNPALYLKYRPRTFEQVDGQAHITQTLRNALAEDRVAHAYLFAGPRGTGKTSTARILAKAVNCLATAGEKPDDTCANCLAINEGRMLDLIEIDAASHTSVDDVRELRDKIEFRPGEAKFKVYIIDEVHMLSTSAFNAFLKTLEEPPPHVVFVFATTDPQKIPATIISRVQRFDFRRLTQQEIVERLNHISEDEKLQVEPEALDLIARQATGSMRDAIGLLDQLTANRQIGVTIDQVQSLLGATPQRTIDELVDRMVQNDLAGGLGSIVRAVDNGSDPKQLARDIVEYFRVLLLMKNKSGESVPMTIESRSESMARADNFSVPQLVRIIRTFNQAAVDLRLSPNPTLPLELAVAESILEGSPTPAVPPTRSSVPPAQNKPTSERRETRRIPETASDPKFRGTNTTQSDGSPVINVGELKSDWGRVVALVGGKNKMTKALLLDAEPLKIEDKQILLGFRFEGHVERFEKQPQHKEVIERAIEEIFHDRFRIKCILSPYKARVKAVESDPLIRTALSQFGAEITDIHDQPAN